MATLSLSSKSTIVRSFTRPTLAIAVGALGRIAPDTAGRLAARAFTTPPRGGAAPAVPVAGPAHPGRRGWVSIDGVRHATWTWGEPERAPAALLVHGWGGRAAQLHAFVGPLLA